MWVFVSMTTHTHTHTHTNTHTCKYVSLTWISIVDHPAVGCEWEYQTTLSHLWLPTITIFCPGVSCPVNQATPISGLRCLPPSPALSLSLILQWLTAYHHLHADYSIKSSGTEHTLASLQSVIPGAALSAFNVLWHTVEEGT